MTPESVLDKALSLTAIASRLRQGAAAEDDAKRIMTRVDELTSLLDDIEAVVGAADRLSERGVAVSLPAMDQGREAFSRLTPAGGLPPVRAFTPAKSKLDRVREEARRAVSQAWAQWTRECVTELPGHRMVVLPPADRRTEETRWANLVKLSKVDVPSRSDVVEFAAIHAGLKEDLDALPDPAPQLQALLTRLGQRTTLAQLSDSDIALLRQYGVADQIELQRRSV